MKYVKLGSSDLEVSIMCLGEYAAAAAAAACSGSPPPTADVLRACMLLIARPARGRRQLLAVSTRRKASRRGMCQSAKQRTRPPPCLQAR